MFRSTSLLLVVLSFFSSSLLAEEYWEYTFRPGDNLWNIAKKYTTSVNNWKEIQHINKIRYGADRKIRPGTRVVIPVAMLKLQPTPAVVIAVSGDVKLVKANGDQAIIKTGDKLYMGDRVTTTEGQTLRLQFADKSELQVLSNSEVMLDKLSYYKKAGMVDTRVRLNSGSVNTWVEKQNKDSHYEILTPAAITAVRGTAFRLSTDEHNVSRTEVTEGVVAVSAGDAEKDVQDGFGIVAERDKPLPEPVKLLPAPVLTTEESADKKQHTISWNALDGAVSYRYQLASDKDFNYLLQDKSVSSTQLVLTDLEPGDYFFKVRGIDKLKLQGLDASTSFEQQDIPEPPPPEPPSDDYWKIIMGIGLLIILF